jgi:hypothetical protein
MTTLPTSKPKPKRAEINANYNGYLKPHAERIRQLASEGKLPLQIGRILFEEGVRSPNEHVQDIDQARTFAGMVNYILRPSNTKKTLQKRIARTRLLLHELEQRARVIDLAEYRTGAARPTNRSI